MAFDVQPTDVVETEKFIEVRFENPPTNALQSGLLTSAQIFTPPALVTFAGGPANFNLPAFADGKYIAIRHLFTPLALLKNALTVSAGPPAMATNVHYKGFNSVQAGSEILYDGHNYKPTTSDRHEELLVQRRKISVIQITGVEVYFTIPLADVWMPDVTGGAGGQTFALDNSGAVHQVFCGLNLLVRIYK